jgi:hypothetical protein
LSASACDVRVIDLVFLIGDQKDAVVLVKGRADVITGIRLFHVDSDAAGAFRNIGLFEFRCQDGSRILL